MQHYGVRDVERVLRLSRSTIRSLVTAGFVTPSRGRRHEFRFSFQDLIVLRAARALIDARVPRRRINRSLDELRKHLPETVPLAGLSISAVGDRVVVREGQGRWQADSGQYVLGLDVSIENGVLHLSERPSPAAAETIEEDWFGQGLELEPEDARRAVEAYERAVTADDCHLSAWTNLGRLLHELGDLKGAEKIYDRALAACEPDATLLFNIAVLFEDMERTLPAIDAYRAALEVDPLLADAHYNLARLYEAVEKPQHAIRHWGEYRRLRGKD